MSVDRQRRSFQCEERFRCPDHKIYISPSTFEYDHETDNLLWKNKTDLALLEAIKSVKRESRIARDNSEDAVSFNVFRYLETTNQLARFLTQVSQTEQRQAELIYWSYSQKSQFAWPELNIARKEFGEHLQRSSEPDLIAVTDKGLFFIEVKLTATNETTPSDHNNRKKYLTGGNEWFKQVFKSDYETIAIKAKKYEIFRFWLLGSWLASQMGLDFFLVNVVLSDREIDIEQRVQHYIRMEPNRQFIRVAWEDIYGFIASNQPENDDRLVILEYFRNKTIGYNHFGVLQKAFAVK